MIIEIYITRKAQYSCKNINVYCETIVYYPNKNIMTVYDIYVYSF